MSYCGYVEYLSSEGYYWTENAHDERGILQIDNKSYKAKYYHAVDQTNGYANHRMRLDADGKPYDESYYDENAPKEAIGFDDFWKTDHYGNRYAVKRMTYKPIGDKWHS